MNRELAQLAAAEIGDRRAELEKATRSLEAETGVHIPRHALDPMGMDYGTLLDAHRLLLDLAAVFESLSRIVHPGQSVGAALKTCPGDVADTLMSELARLGVIQSP